MRIIWKDTRPEEYKPFRYRKFMVLGTPAGWEVTVPGDHNIYRTHYSAQNAIDQYYGDLGKHGNEKRRKYGIEIIGKRDGETA